MSKKRPIEPQMQVLWDRLDDVSALLDGFVQILVGERRGVTLMVHPAQEGFATLSISNLKDNVEAVRAWLKAHDDGEMEKLK